MALTPNDSRNAYVQIADDIRRQIRNGEYGPGDKLPSTADLVTKYDVANMTIQGAFRVLREENLIYSVQGRGTFVRSDVVVGNTNAGEVASTGEYLALREQIDKLVDVVGNLEERVSQVEQSQNQANVETTP